MKPNIVYILADDMGYGDISALNPQSKIHTPHMDEIKKKGLHYTDAHASSAVCTPSRYSILTGRYCWRSTLKQNVLNGYDSHLIEDNRYTVGHLLQDQGYATACIGKWHLGMDWAHNEDNEFDFARPIQYGPTAFGFDYFYGISASLDMPPYVYIENDRVTSLPTKITSNDGLSFWREGPTAPDFKHEDVLPRLTEKALEFIDTHQEEPFFLYFPLPAPHTPILPTKEFQGKSGLSPYGDFVMMCDDVVGQLSRRISDLGLEDNTIFVYTSDNGCSPAADTTGLESKGHFASYIYRGYKADIYEGGHRIPLLIQWPNKISPGSQIDETVCLSDLMATLADLLDVSLPDHVGEDSVSHLPLWLGNKLDTPLREGTVHHSIDGSLSIRKGPWKLELCAGSGGWSYPTKNEIKGLPPVQLYHIETDPAETTNVYDQHPHVVEELKHLLASYIKNGRSTPGTTQKNTVPEWEQMKWTTSY